MAGDHLAVSKEYLANRGGSDFSCWVRCVSLLIMVGCYRKYSGCDPRGGLVSHIRMCTNQTTMSTMKVLQLHQFQLLWLAGVAGFHMVDSNSPAMFKLLVVSEKLDLPAWMSCVFCCLKLPECEHHWLLLSSWFSTMGSTSTTISVVVHDRPRGGRRPYKAWTNMPLWNIIAWTYHKPFTSI